MIQTFSTDPNYWNVLAIKELSNKTLITEKLRIKYEYTRN